MHCEQFRTMYPIVPGLVPCPTSVQCERAIMRNSWLFWLIHTNGDLSWERDPVPEMGTVAN